jgi:hypothetical protein
MPVDKTRFKMFQSGLNKALGGGVKEEDQRGDSNRRAREDNDAELERERERQREAARRERQGI